MRTVCLILIILSYCNSLAAQRKFVTGCLKDSTTGSLIVGAKIENSTSVDIVYSKENGLFRIQAKNGDLLIISRDGYNSQFFHYLDSAITDTLFVNLIPSGKMLLPVVVSAHYDDYQIDSLSRRRDFEKLRGFYLKSISRAEGFGITLSLDRIFKTEYRRLKRNEKAFNERERAAYVQYRFPRDKVSSYTGLKGKQLDDFIKSHTPSYDWLRKHSSDEEVFQYINERVKIFRSGSN